MDILEIQSSHRRRRTTAQVISFDNDPEDDGFPDSYSASTNCLSTSAQSASILSSTPTDQKSFNFTETNKKLDQHSYSSTDSSYQEFDSSKIDSIVEEKPVDVQTTLIPFNDNNVGELIVITAEEAVQEITADSDDERSDSVLNLKFKQPLKPEDYEAVLNSVEEVKDINSTLKTKLVSLANKKKEENTKLQNQLQVLTRYSIFITFNYFIYLISPHLSLIFFV